MPLTQIKAAIAQDMMAVDELIQLRLRSEVVLINQLGRYIVGNGGKRLRPMLVLLSARACGYDRHEHIKAAAIVELIHTATLLHDDVVDGSQLRRGQRTANALWGNEPSVLVGDFLYSRAFEMMVELGSMRVMEILAHVTNAIAEGEVLQLLNFRDADTTEERYMQVIRSKTAKLFEAGGQLGAVLGGMDGAVEEALTAYGVHLGTAFQLVDDILDYRAASHEMGKNNGDDLAEGNPTLPLIYAMQNGSAEQRAVVRGALEHGGVQDMAAVFEAVESTGAIAYTEDLAWRESECAAAQLDCLPESTYKSALRQLAELSVKRNA